jgi:hypothetical protein
MSRQKPCPALQSAPQKLDIAHTRAIASPPPHPHYAQRQCTHPVLAELDGQPVHVIGGLVEMVAGRLVLCELGGKP